MVEINMGTKWVQTRAYGLKNSGNEANQLSEYNLRVGFAWDPDLVPKNPLDNFPRGPGNGLIIWSEHYVHPPAVGPGARGPPRWSMGYNV